MEFVTPVQQRMRNLDSSKHPAKGLLVKAKGPAEPFMKIAAKNAWWNLKEVVLKRVAASVGGFVVDPQWNFAEFLVWWTKHLLECSDEEAFTIVSQRFKNMEYGSTDILDQFTLINEQEELMDEEDAAETEKDKEQLKNHRKQLDVLMQQWMAMKTRVMGKGPCCANDKHNARLRKAALNRGEKIYTSAFPRGNDLTQPQLSALLPPRCYVWMDCQNGGWQSHYPPFARIGKRWSSHGGSFGAAVKILRDCWMKHSIITCRPVGEACPIVDLFDESLAGY